MAHEFILKFSAPDWYSQHRNDVRTRVLALPSLAKQVTERELWLRARDSQGRWPYDVRIFLDPDSILVEVTNFGSAYFQDVRDLVSSLASTVGVELTDDDGQAVSWPSAQEE
jgi:hypothetical protein